MNILKNRNRESFLCFADGPARKGILEVLRLLVRVPTMHPSSELSSLTRPRSDGVREAAESAGHAGRPGGEAHVCRSAEVRLPAAGNSGPQER